ncbi:MAG: hypothetical protein RLZZ301_1560 [Bacteroidota bacterium]|jgi:hypothetical protein
MKVETIFLRSASKFSAGVQSWAAAHATEVVQVSEKLTDFFDRCDSLLIFNQNQELSAEIEELKTAFDKQQKAVHKIDINGTLQVGISALDLWVETNKCKHVYLVGVEELVGNPNLERYLGV